MNTNELQNRIEALMSRAETGEQWAEICRLEASLTACWLCGVMYGTRKQHNGYSSEPAQYVCEDCFTSEVACFDDLPAI